MDVIILLKERVFQHDKSRRAHTSIPAVLVSRACEPCSLPCACACAIAATFPRTRTRTAMSTSYEDLSRARLTRRSHEDDLMGLFLCAAASVV
jgi:hypothetical protein